MKGFSKKMGSLASEHKRKTNKREKEIITEYITENISNQTHHRHGQHNEQNTEILTKDKKNSESFSKKKKLVYRTNILYKKKKE